MMAPGVMLGTFQQLHLQLADLSQIPRRKLRLDLLYRRRPRSEPDYLLHDDSNKLVDLDEVLRLGSACCPETKERLECRRVQARPLQQERREDVFEIRPCFHCNVAFLQLVVLLPCYVEVVKQDGRNRKT